MLPFSRNAIVDPQASLDGFNDVSAWCSPFAAEPICNPTASGLELPHSPSRWYHHFGERASRRGNGEWLDLPREVRSTYWKPVGVSARLSLHILSTRNFFSHAFCPRNLDLSRPCLFNYVCVPLSFLFFCVLQPCSFAPSRRLHIRNHRNHQSSSNQIYPSVDSD